MAGHQLESNGVAEARTGAPSLLFIVPQKIISCLHQSVAYATVNLAGSCEEMRLTGAEESLPGNMPCLLDGAGSILGTYGSQAWIFPFALFPEKEESQGKKSDRTFCVGDNLEEPLTFDLSVLSFQGESPSRSWDTNKEVAHGIPWKQCGSCTEGAGPRGVGSRYREWAGPRDPRRNHRAALTRLSPQVLPPS